MPPLGGFPSTHGKTEHVLHMRDGDFPRMRATAYAGSSLATRSASRHLNLLEFLCTARKLVGQDRTSFLADEKKVYANRPAWIKILNIASRSFVARSKTLRSISPFRH
jgi:hypothetical protein